MRLQELTQLHGVSGYETEVRAYLEDVLRGKVDELSSDGLGNLIAYQRGSGERKQRMMFAAHMDEIGFQVIKVQKDGLLMVKNMGHSFIHIAYGARIRFRNGTVGVISARVHADKLGSSFTDLYVDIGANTEEDARKVADVGDVACYVGEYQPLVGSAVLSKAVDDRMGCAMMVEAIERVPRPYHDVFWVFSVQEEVGTRGAKVAAHRIKPEIGISVDVTPHHDRPGDLEGSNTQGAGVAVKISDTSVICDERIVRRMLDLCARDGIKCQKDVLYVGGNDAAAINLSGEGVRVGEVSVVTRYTHGDSCMVDLDDVEAGVKLICALVLEPSPV